jgi:hypothetical protein
VSESRHNIDLITRPAGPGGLPAAGARSGSNGSRGDSLIDLLDRVLDKGVVIAGDIKINLLDIELLTIKIRLLIASADKAKEMGIDWWAHDPQLSSNARREQEKLGSDRENKELRQRIAELESRMNALLESASPDARERSRSALPAGRRGARAD